MKEETFADQAATRFDRLRERCADPGFRAALRHWLTDAGRPRSYQALIELRGTLDDEDFNTVAALYAFHPDHRADRNGVGCLCRQLSAGLCTLEGRFKRLLLCSAGELHQHLLAIVLAARAKALALDYLQLYLDLRSWRHDHYGPLVRQRWAEEFWSPAPEAATIQPGEVPA